MNIYECKILQELAKTPYKSQRILAESCNCSLGIVNHSLKQLAENDYISPGYGITQKAKEIFHASCPKNAIILAAGSGMRMIPINISKPKGLIEVFGEPLIERQIKQLHYAGIYDITIIVGFMKEQHEYLIDKYDVKLIVNPNYTTKNNLHSLSLALDNLSNTYIIPCDIWCEENPFHLDELYSWYMVSDMLSEESSLKINRKMQLVNLSENIPGNTMIGISYLLENEANMLKKKIKEMCNNKQYNHSFWEEALMYKGKMIVAPKLVSAHSVKEFNTYEQLREMDKNSNQLNADAIHIIAKVLNTNTENIKNISVLKKGMTNRSFTFDCEEQTYIMRIPGEGTEHLINRKDESAVYQIINNTPYCDEVLYINPQTGYKITKYWDNTRTCNPYDKDDVQKCMELLRSFHLQEFIADHEFDIFQQIQYYESLWNENSSAYPDYMQTKEKVFSLQPFIQKHNTKKILTHMDAVPDNFLFTQHEGKPETIHLIDWEYASMQDPHVDIAMFCIYAMYDREMIDYVINSYFNNKCSHATRIKIYCYIASCGLLWSNWCEYKQQLGVEFGEYSLCQYRYAKVYYNIVQKELGEYESG